ncbi:zinc finger [Sparganum proliferum]
MPCSCVGRARSLVGLASDVRVGSPSRNVVQLLCDSSKRLIQLLPQHIEAFIAVPLLTSPTHQGSPASARSDEESVVKRTASRMIGVGCNASQQGLASPSEVAFLARLLIALQLDFISFLRTGFFPTSLVAEVLSQDQIFHSFLATESGRKLIREWLLLSLPSLLRREPKDLALWASTVCLLSSAPDGVLRATLSLCCCPAGRSMIESDDHVKAAGASGLTQSQLLAVTARSKPGRGGQCPVRLQFGVELETSAEEFASGLAALLKYFFPPY